MSSVLKALKKLDEEKRGGASAPASSQRWASGGQPERRGRFWLLAGSGLAVALLLVLVLLWAGRKPASVVTAPAEVSAPATAAGLSVQPEAPVAAAPRRIEPVPPKAESPPPVTAPQPASQFAATRPRSQVTPDSIAPAVAGPPVTAPPPPVAPIASVVREAPAEIAVKQVQVNRFEIPAPGQEWVAPPQLSVSDILPPTGGERMAIVNGLPVMAGTMVEEALVEEILEDRVLFVIGGKRVTVPLHKGR